MHELINKLAFSLFKKNSVEDCSLEEISELVKQYPYFSPAQLLLAARQKLSGHPDAENQLSNASLHITNPLWLDHLLNHTSTVATTILNETIPEEEVIHEPNNDELVLDKKQRQFINASKHGSDVVSAPTVFTSEKSGTKEESLVFEPYHTVDYFASQGIKEVVEENPKDRFSQQLKSFTEWLKTIKHLPPRQIAAMSDGQTENKVIKLADDSIEDRNIETEAMAEVWIKQGQPEKAVGIYRKLSLLNPSKSSYFASLIENLKRP